MILTSLSRQSRLAPPFGSTAGFSFLGLILVILILSLTTAGLLTVSQPSLSVRRMAITQRRATELRRAINNYILSHGGTTGTNPPNLASLVTSDGTACTANNTPGAGSMYKTVQGWCGPYTDVVFTQDASAYRTDGWGTLFLYNSTTNILTSCGPNRVCGDSDDLAYGP
jgi:type II secretory pathway pseudopilin PulG